MKSSYEIQGQKEQENSDQLDIDALSEALNRMLKAEAESESDDIGVKLINVMFKMEQLIIAIKYTVPDNTDKSFGKVTLRELINKLINAEMLLEYYDQAIEAGRALPDFMFETEIGKGLNNSIKQFEKSKRSQISYIKALKNLLKKIGQNTP